jgi:hypothetical protein
LGRRNQSRYSGAQIFSFSVLDQNQGNQRFTRAEGQYVKLSYVERYKTFAWWDTKYLYIDVKRRFHTDLNRKHEKSL